MKIRHILLFFLLIPLAGCDSTDTTDPAVMLPTTTMQLGNRQFVMEKATTFGQQERGLMRRDSLADDHGMIFIFPKIGPETFWNHDVRFPLDVVFLDDQAKIVSIQQMKPYDDTNTQTVQAQYVIELNKGTADKLGLKVGDQITLPADAKAP
jgi:uncharacterized membrane protein (UPF0127 family)